MSKMAEYALDQEALREAVSEKTAEVLEALKRVTNILDAFGDLPDDLMDPEAWIRHAAEESIASARAIIAKAEGR